MNKKNLPFMIIFFIFFIFAVLSLYTHIDHNIIEWDEAVNIGIAKHYASWGDSGLFEPGRPGFYPFILSIFQVLGFDILVISKIIAFLSAVFMVLLLYVVTKKIFDGAGGDTRGEDIRESFGRHAGFFAVLVFVPTQIFLQRFHFGGTDIFPITLMLFASWLLLKRKYFWAGILSACIFITRFPHAIYIVAVAIGFLLLLLQNLKRWKFWFWSAAKYGLGVLLLIVPFFMLNYHFFIDVSPNWMYAAFRPIWEQSRTISIVGQATNVHTGFYFLQLLKNNFFLLLGLLGLVWAAIDFQISALASRIKSIKKPQQKLKPKKEKIKSKEIIRWNKYLVLWTLILNVIII